MNTATGAKDGRDLATSQFDELDFDAVDATVRDEFDRMRDAVDREIPGVRSRAGRVRDASSTFVHRAFDRIDGDDADPVLIGVTVKMSGDCWLVLGDISGEETGRVYFDDHCELRVETSREAVRASREVAARIAARLDILLVAIRDRSYNP